MIKPNNRKYNYDVLAMNRRDYIRDFIEKEKESKTTLELRGGEKARIYLMRIKTDFRKRNIGRDSSERPHGTDFIIHHEDFPFKIRAYIDPQGPAYRRRFKNQNIVRLTGPNPGKPTEKEIRFHFKHWEIITARFINENNKNMDLLEIKSYQIDNILKSGYGMDKGFWASGEKGRRNTIYLYLDTVPIKKVISLSVLKDPKILIDPSTTQNINEFMFKIFERRKK